MNSSSGLAYCGDRGKDSRQAWCHPLSCKPWLIQSREPQPLDWPMCKAGIVGRVSQPHYRSLVADFLDVWQAQATIASPEAVALALITAAHSEQVHRDQQSLELVWTGPDMGVVPLRRSEAVTLFAGSRSDPCVADLEIDEPLAIDSPRGTIRWAAMLPDPFEEQFEEIARRKAIQLGVLLLVQ